MFKNISMDTARAFVLIAEKRTFALAGKEVGRTQSAISHQMQVLEKMLGCELFVREGRVKVLTPIGETVYQYMKQLTIINDILININIVHEIKSNVIPFEKP
jgi:DNA-binding transcriptional LysR family regulator